MFQDGHVIITINVPGMRHSKPTELLGVLDACQLHMQLHHDVVLC
jgi:hypothetical protein